ncbi:MAG: hypothetical protein ACE5JS_14410 [Nitrospinota bacterium]
MSSKRFTAEQVIKKEEARLKKLMADHVEPRVVHRAILIYCYHRFSRECRANEPSPAFQGLKGLLIPWAGDFSLPHAVAAI